MRKLLAAAGSLALVGLAAGCSSSATVINHATSGGAVAHVGATLQLKTQAGRNFNITLTKVADPATSTNQSSPPKGKRFIAAVFHITNTSSQTLTTDGDLDANLVGNNGQIYLPTHRALSDCSSHTPRVELASGKSGTSCESFQVATSISIAKVQFYPAAGSASDYGEWLVP